MLIAIPCGYFVAILLLISGVYSGVDFLQNRPDSSIGPDVLQGLIVSAWPVIVASVILLLIQVNRQLEKLRLVASYTPSPQPLATPGKKAKKSRPAKEEAQAPAAPARPAATGPNLAELARSTAPAAPASPNTPTGVVPLYPNSPIPGGGRVPQASPAPLPAAAPEPQPGTGKRAPRKDEARNLSFFKVD